MDKARCQGTNQLIAEGCNLLLHEDIRGKIAEEKEAFNPVEEMIMDELNLGPRSKTEIMIKIPNDHTETTLIELEMNKRIKIVAGKYQKSSQT